MASYIYSYDATNATSRYAYCRWNMDTGALVSQHILASIGELWTSPFDVRNQIVYHGSGASSPYYVTAMSGDSVVWTINRGGLTPNGAAASEGWLYVASGNGIMWYSIVDGVYEGQISWPTGVGGNIVYLAFSVTENVLYCQASDTIQKKAFLSYSVNPTSGALTLTNSVLHIPVTAGQVLQLDAGTSGIVGDDQTAVGGLRRIGVFDFSFTELREIVPQTTPYVVCNIDTILQRKTSPDSLSLKRWDWEGNALSDITLEDPGWTPAGLVLDHWYPPGDGAPPVGHARLPIWQPSGLGKHTVHINPLGA